MKQTQTSLIYLFAWVARRISTTLGWMPSIFMLLCFGFCLYFLSEKQALKQSLIAPDLAEQEQLLDDAYERSSKTISTEEETSAQVHEISESEAIENFLEQLPIREDLELWMAKIANLAQKQGVSMNTGNYQWKAKEAQGLSVAVSEYSMHFVLHGTYLKCRNFVATVLKHYPFIALSEMDIIRSEVGQAEVDVKVTFTVFIKRAAS